MTQTGSKILDKMSNFPPTCGNVRSAQCPSRAILKHLTSKWGLLLILVLSESTTPLRFSDLRRKIGGISEKMLAQTLQTLEMDNLIIRRDHETIPPHVDYHLSKLGTSVAPHIQALTNWIELNLDALSSTKNAL